MTISVLTSTGFPSMRYGRYSQVCTALSAAPSNIGSPLTRLMPLTLPSLVITALKTTVPSMCLSRAASGYKGPEYLTSSGSGPTAPEGGASGNSKLEKNAVGPEVIIPCCLGANDLEL